MYEGVCKKGVESFAIFVGADSTFILFPYAFHTWSEFKLDKFSLLWGEAQLYLPYDCL